MTTSSEALSEKSARQATQVAAIVAAVAIAATVITRVGRTEGISYHQYAYFFQQFLFDDYIHASAMLAGLLIAVALAPVRDLASRLAGAATEYPRRTSLVTFAILGAASSWIYRGHPFSMDEYAPMVQAHAFAQGDLTAHYPVPLLDLVIPPVFQGWFFYVNGTTGEAVSAYWPGLALLLTPFAWLNLESWLNPGLSAVALWLIGDLAVKAGGDERCRGWAMLAALASPQFTVNAISFYAMPGLLAFNLLFIWLLLRPSWQGAFMAGVAGSVALVMHNPLPHVLVAAPCLIWLAAQRSRWPRVVAVAIGYAPLALALGLGWPMLLSSMSPTETTQAAGSGVISEWLARASDVFTVPSMHTLLVRWYSAWKAWIWTVPGLLLLPFLVKQRGPIYWLLLSGFLLTFAFYFFVPFDQGYGWGYRYIHPAWGALPILGGVWLATSSGKARVLAASLVSAGLLATPVFLAQTHMTVSGALSLRPAAPSDGNWVVFVAMKPGFPSAEVVQNYPGEGRVLYLFSQGSEADAAVIQARFPQATRALSDARGSIWRLPKQDAAPSSGESQ